MPGFLGGSSSGSGTGGEILFPKEFIDPVTKLRVSQPENLIDTDFEYGLQPTKWETVELINNTPSFFSKSGDTTIPGIVSITTNAGTREITVVTALDHALAVGIPINVTGTKSITADGSYIINSIPNTTTFTYLCKDNQDTTSSIEDLYSSIITGEFFQGSQLRVANSGGITTNAESTSVLTVTTESAHGFGVNTPFYFLNLNSTVSQEFEAANTASKSFDSSNSATAQTFDGSNSLSTVNIDWSNSATIGGTVSTVSGQSTINNTITVSHGTETFANQPIGTPLYYSVSTSTGYFAANPRGVVFLKTIDALNTPAGQSTFKVSALPDGDVIAIEASISGTFQLANQARTFAGNNIDSSTEISIPLISESALALEGANDGGLQTSGLYNAGNPLSTVANYSGSLVNVTTTAGVGLGYYQGAMLKYSTTGSAASGLTNNATYFVDSFFSTGTDTYAFTLKQLPNSPSVITVSGGTGTQTFSRIGVSVDKNIWHIKNSNYVKGDMLEYVYPENGEVVTDTNKKYFFVSTVYDTHNYILDDSLFSATVATGGTLSTTVYNGQTWNVHTFTTVGTSTFTVSSVGTDPTVDVLIVAGGGSGAGGLGGGGGAGGVIDTTTDATVTKPTVTAQAYSIVVGAGATGVVAGESITTNNATNPSSNGANSSAFGLIALGGGGAGHHREVRGFGLAGGSGGGGNAGPGSTSTRAAGLQPTSASKGYGSAGGVQLTFAEDWPGGGGGGARELGESPASTAQDGGKGGNGHQSFIDGRGFYYGGGGGGASYVQYDRAGGNGGVGGGGGGGNNSGQRGGSGLFGRNLPTAPGLNRNDAAGDPAGGNGGANTGGGGGGGGWNQSRGGDGGSGIVIVRYPITPKQVIAPVATGGETSTVTIDNITWKIHQFKTTGTSNFVISEPGNLGAFDYLIVAGGGSGGSYVGGGGGAGGVLAGALTPNSGTYPVVVGAGGAAAGSTTASTNTFGNNGSNSSVFGLTAIGGGGGGIYAHGVGKAGGSGGGSGGFQDGSSAGGTGTVGQGTDGGSTFGSRPRSFTGGAGGGGAAQEGKYSDNIANRGGDGGDGIQSYILGTVYYFGGGGGGGNFTDGASPGNGGRGGGGGGSSNSANVAGIGGAGGLNVGVNGSPNGDPNNRGGDGGANTGGGGGGCGHYGLSGAGGSGIVIIRYPIAIA